MQEVHQGTPELGCGCYSRSSKKQMSRWNYMCEDFIGEGLEEGRATDCNAGLTEQRRDRERSKKSIPNGPVL